MDWNKLVPCKQSLLSYWFARLAVSIDRQDYYLVGRFHLYLRGYKHCSTPIIFLHPKIWIPPLSSRNNSGQKGFVVWGVFSVPREEKEFPWFISYPWEIFPHFSRLKFISLHVLDWLLSIWSRYQRPVNCNQFINLNICSCRRKKNMFTTCYEKKMVSLALNGWVW